MKVVWSKQARNSLADIYDYISQDNPTAADNVLETILIKAESLTRIIHQEIFSGARRKEKSDGRVLDVL